MSQQRALRGQVKSSESPIAPLGTIFKAGQYVFAIHNRPRNCELRDRISQVLYPSNLDGQQKVYWHDVHHVAAGEGLWYTPPRRASCPIAGSF